MSFEVNITLDFASIVSVRLSVVFVDLKFSLLLCDHLTYEVPMTIACHTECICVYCGLAIGLSLFS